MSSDKERERLLENKNRKLYIWYIILAFFLIGALFPVYWMIVTSFKSFREIYSPIPGFLPAKIQWGNYIKLFEKYGFGESLKNSLFVSVIVAATSTFLSTLSAYFITRLKFPFRKQIALGILVLYLIPRTILFIPMYLFVNKIGVGDNIWRLIITYPTITIPYAIWVLISYFQNLSVEMEEAARVDGATRWQIIWKIVLPVSLPGIASTFMFCFTLCWSEYIYALVMISSDTQRTLVLALSNMAVGDIIPWGSLMAGASISALPVMIIYLFASKYIVGGLTMGSVKG